MNIFLGHSSCRPHTASQVWRWPPAWARWPPPPSSPPPAPSASRTALSGLGRSWKPYGEKVQVCSLSKKHVYINKYIHREAKDNHCFAR